VLKKVNTPILIGLILALAGVFVLVFLSYYQINDAEKKSRELINKQDQLSAAFRILIEIQSMETGQRGYVLTKDPKFLASYQQGLKNLSVDTIQFRTIKPVVAHNQEFTEDIMKLVRLKLTHMAQVVDLQKKSYSDSAQKLISQREGLSLMTAIRNSIDDFENHQYDQLSTLSTRITQVSAQNILKLTTIGFSFF
jgi:CHASE3 domain sensor protein